MHVVLLVQAMARRNRSWPLRLSVALIPARIHSDFRPPTGTRFGGQRRGSGALEVYTETTQ